MNESQALVMIAFLTVFAPPLIMILIGLFNNKTKN